MDLIPGNPADKVERPKKERYVADYYKTEELEQLFEATKEHPLSQQIQEWLGHSDISTKANIYSHLDFSSKITSANVMNGTLSLPETIGMQEWVVNND